MPRTVIAHATDLSGEDRSAFHHASALAAASGARLVTIHGSAGAVEPGRLPDAAPLAARWGRAIDQERICHECCDDAADTVIDAVRRLAPDLVVAGTHGRHGLAALLAGSVAEAVARNIPVATLIVPNGAPGFVDVETGAIDLARILVPGGDGAEAASGMEAARAFAALAGARTVEFIPLHASPAHVVSEIIDAAAARGAGLIVMATRGHDGLADVLRGSHTERVLRDAACPVLSVPAGR
jgi:nucleotide-binding universal stress UspA family protein